jgi:hypothetical protein
MKSTLLFFALVLAASPVRAQDAAALEAQYRLCAKHFIPADKCTPEIYQQLKDKDDAPLDAETAQAVEAVNQFRTKLRNQDSLQLQVAYLTNYGDLCLQVAGQNAFGGMSVMHVVRLRNGKWRYERSVLTRGFLGWGGWFDGVCIQGTVHPKMVPGRDITDKVQAALKARSESAAGGGA